VEHCYRRWKTRHASHLLGALLVVMMHAALVSGCSLYATGRAFIEQPLETIECLPECPFYTEPILLRHPGTGVIVECGPYPYALSIPVWQPGIEPSASSVSHSNSGRAMYVLPQQQEIVDEAVMQWY